MVKKRFLKAIALFLLFAGVSAGAYAQYADEGGGVPKEGGGRTGAITVSVGFALSYMEASISGDDYTAKGDIGAGGNAYLDYLLPISKPISIGFEVGVDSASFTTEGNYKDRVLAIPLLIRGAWHFDLMPKLDLYGVAKIGMAFGNWSGDTYDAVKGFGMTIDTPMGFAFGFDLGAAYYFTSSVGAFVEVGFDDYMLESKISGNGRSYTLEAPFYRFLTAGISLKF